MSAQPIVLRPDQHEPALNVVGTQVTVLASNAARQSDGITLQQGREGTGPPQHSHARGEAKGAGTFLRCVNPRMTSFEMVTELCRQYT
jgi:hypothetical protein